MIAIRNHRGKLAQIPGFAQLRQLVVQRGREEIMKAPARDSDSARESWRGLGERRSHGTADQERASIHFDVPSILLLLRAKLRIAILIAFDLAFQLAVLF